MPFKVLVVGGAGGMGRWCAGVFKSAGFDVYISSRRDASAEARSMGVKVSGPEEAGSFDVVVLSVPMDTVEDVASAVAPAMRPGSLLMDLSSLKKTPLEAMLRHAPPGVEVIGVHPLFGPAGDPRGRNIVLVPTGRSERWLSVLHDIFRDAGLEVLEATAEEHDRNMAVVQGLTHFMYVALGRALEKAHADLGQASAFRTPVYGVTKEMLGRVLSQSPELYALIQSSEYARLLRRAYVEACQELASELDEGKLREFIRDFESAARYYGDTAAARKRSERILLKDMELRLSVMDSIGRERAFNIDGRAVYGIVKNAGPDDFVLGSADGPLTLNYEDVSPISGHALEALKATSEPFISRDIIVKMPVGADPSTLKWVISKVEGVRSVGFELMDTRGADQVLSRFTVSVPVAHSEEVLQMVLKTIWSLGLEIR
jgi:prephenate dehydrogenase